MQIMLIIMIIIKEILPFDMIFQYFIYFNYLSYNYNHTHTYIHTYTYMIIFIDFIKLF